MRRKLKIAQIAPLIERVPPKKYGGTERVVSALTEELVRRGHDVTLFASRDSITKAKLESIYPKALRETSLSNSQKLDWSMYHIGRAYRLQEEFDIIHDHNSTIGVPIANLAKTPTVITIHGIVRQSNQKLYESFINPTYVSISKDQIKDLNNLRKYVTIPNGLPLKKYTFGKTPKNYLLFLGRISMVKGLHHAISVATKLNIPLVIAAKLDEVDKPYFKEFIEPRLTNDLITWVGEVDENQRNQLLSQALCLLNPITWREPFGLNMIEAMACGCPVVAFNDGSIPEVIEDGKTGFIVQNEEKMIEAVKRIKSIDRQYCRDYALSKFNDRVMTDGYEQLYYNILADEAIKSNDRFITNILNNDSFKNLNYLNYSR